MPGTRMIPDVSGPDGMSPDRTRATHNPKVAGSNPARVYASEAGTIADDEPIADIGQRQG